MIRDRFAVLAAAIACASPAAAQTPVAFMPDQAGYIVYDRCMMQAAIQASRTDAPAERIFALAQAACADTRAQVTLGQEYDARYIAALAAADADKERRFPVWIKGVRERRAAFEGMAGASY